MSWMRQLLCAVCAVAFLGTNPAVSPAETITLGPGAGQGSAATSSGAISTVSFLLVRPDRSSPAAQLIACKSEGTPCRSDGQCCSGACIKGLAEGRPGAWCGSDSNRRPAAARPGACPKHFYRCSLNAGGKIDPKHPGCCWDLTVPK